MEICTSHFVKATQSTGSTAGPRPFTGLRELVSKGTREMGDLLSSRPFEVPRDALVPGLRYLDGPTLASLFVLGPDMAPVETEVNRLNNQALVHYYEEEWRRWN